MIKTKKQRRLRIKRRISKKIRGVAQKPRVSIYKSNTRIYVQVVDDEAGKTLCALSSDALEKNKKNVNIQDAKELGSLLAKKCIEIGLSKILFDRSGYRYHGKIKSLADGAREGGLQF